MAVLQNQFPCPHVVEVLQNLKVLMPAVIVTLPRCDQRQVLGGTLTGTLRPPKEWK